MAFLMFLWGCIQIGVHLLVYKYEKLHLRLRILCMCLAQSLFVFFYYGTMNEITRT